MSDISRDELKTILLFAVHIAKIDDDFDPWEKKILRRFATEMGLTDEEKQELAQTKVSLVKSLRNLKSADSNHLLIKTLCAVSFVDGAATGDELEFIEKVVVKLETQVFILPREEWGQYEDEVFNTLLEDGL